MKAQIIETSFLTPKSTEIAASVPKQKSALVIAKEDLKNTLDGNVRSLSSYFKELRKNAVDKTLDDGTIVKSKVKVLLSEAVAKGRRFSESKVHDILNIGNLEPIRAADVAYQATRKQPEKFWTGNRIERAFLNACEIKG